MAATWLPPLILQLFSPRFFEGQTLLYNLAVFVWISLLIVFIYNYTNHCSYLQMQDLISAEGTKSVKLMGLTMQSLYGATYIALFRIPQIHRPPVGGFVT